MLAEKYGESAISTFGSAKSLREALKKDSFKLIILDIKLGDETAFSLIPFILECNKKQKILIFSMYPEKTVAKVMFNLGAAGFVNKEEDNHVIFDAVEKILKGGQFISKNLQSYYADKFIKGESTQNVMESLSKRELEVLMLLLSGDGLIEISSKLDIATSTAGTYKDRVFKKMKVNNLIELYNFCLKLGLV